MKTSVTINSANHYITELNKELETSKSEYIKIMMQPFLEGKPNLVKLFQMNNETLLKTLDHLIGNLLPKGFFVNKPTVRKIIVNDTAEKIEISFYDNLTIEAHGISFAYEHHNTKHLIKTASLKIGE